MVSIFLSSGFCVLQAHRHLGGGGQLLVPNIGLRQGVWQQITGDAFSCPHILPWATRRCPIQRTSQGRPDNQVGGLDTLALSCEYEPNQVGSELQIPAHTPPLCKPLVSAAGERSKHLDVCQRSMNMLCPGDSTFPPGRLPTSNLANLSRPRPRPPSPHRPCPARGAP